FLVRHQVSCQAHLHCRYQIESCAARYENPSCQHDLSRLRFENIAGTLLRAGLIFYRKRLREWLSANRSFLLASPGSFWSSTCLQEPSASLSAAHFQHFLRLADFKTKKAKPA